MTPAAGEARRHLQELAAANDASARAGV